MLELKEETVMGSQEESDEDDSDAESNDEGDETEDSSDPDEDEVADVGEEAGKALKQVENPLYQDSGSDVSDDSDDDDSDDDSDDDEKDEAKPKKDSIDDEDDLIATLKNARAKKIRESPPDIKLKESATDLSFHPEENLISVVNIQGEVSVFKFANEENTLVKKLKVHKSGVRCVEYSHDGSRLITAGQDRCLKILDPESWKLLNGGDSMVHPSPLYSLAPTNHGAVSGDEDGTVKLWDFRTNKSVLSSKRFDEFVSAFHVDEDRNIIIAASGEGTIQSYDLRMNKADTQSEVYSSELNCLCAVREGTKVVVGSGEGVLYLFNQGQYGYHSDQYPGHPDAINNLLAVTDNVVLTGCEDGTIRALHLFPHRFIGQVGHHEGDMPIEKMDVSGAGDIIASIGHDNRVKFWNISYLEKMEYERKRKPLVQKNKVQKKKKLVESVARELEHQLPSSGRINKRDFFQGFKD